MATLLPELRGRRLKIGTLEVWQPPRQIALQPEMGDKLRVLMPLSVPSRSGVQGLRGKTRKHPLWALERECRTRPKYPSSPKPRELKWGTLGHGTQVGLHLF